MNYGKVERSFKKEGDKMAVSEAQKKATAKYEKHNYDKVLLRLDKGDKDRIKAHADSRNESVNGFIKRAIDETIERDNDGFKKLLDF
jgi:predicted HicB family RNase H-like nuclease